MEVKGNSTTKERLLAEKSGKEGEMVQIPRKYSKSLLGLLLVIFVLCGICLISMTFIRFQGSTSQSGQSSSRSRRELNETNGKYKETLLQCQETASKYENATTHLQSEIKKFKARMVESENKRSQELASKIAEMANRQPQLQDENEQLKAKILESENRRNETKEKYKETLLQCQETASKYENATNHLQSEVKKFKARVVESENKRSQELASKSAEMANIKSQLQNENDRLKAKIVESDNKRNHLQSEVERLETKVAELERTRATLIEQSGYVHRLKGFSYKIHTTTLEWERAEEICQSEGAHLASIHSYEENQFLYNMAKNNHHYLTWIGLEYVWIQLKLSSNWTWSDGSATDYLNWMPGEPTGIANGHRWATISQQLSVEFSEVWLANSGAKPFICKKRSAT